MRIVRELLRAERIVLLIGGVFLVPTSTLAAPKTWSPDQALTAEMDSPVDGAKVGVGKTLSCRATGRDPGDKWTRVSPPPLSGTESDNVTFTWSCSAGSFPYGNQGASVTWKAPDSLPNPAGTVTISVMVDDIPGAITPPDSGTRDDSCTGTSVTVIVRDIVGVLEFGNQWEGDGPYTLPVALTVTIIPDNIPAVGDSISWSIDRVTTDPAGFYVAPDNYASIYGDAVTGANGQAHATLVWDPTDYYDGDRYIWVDATDNSW